MPLLSLLNSNRILDINDDWKQRRRKRRALVESMRKDVECTFGIMIARWRILKFPIQVHGTKANGNEKNNPERE